MGYIEGYFGHHFISNITDDIVEGYWNHCKGFYVWGEGVERLELNERRLGSKSKTSKNIKRKPSFGTLRAEAVIINEFFKWCAKDKQGYLAKPFRLSAIEATTRQERALSNRRPTFTRQEWNTISTNLFHKALKTNPEILSVRQASMKMGACFFMPCACIKIISFRVASTVYERDNPSVCCIV